MKFRKKPIVVEAVQYLETYESNREIINWTHNSKTPAFMDIEIKNFSKEFPDGFDYPCLLIRTLEGTMKVNKNDWVIKGIDGEFYPCKSDIFEKTYEKVE